MCETRFMKENVTVPSASYVNCMYKAWGVNVILYAVVCHIVSINRGTMPMLMVFPLDGSRVLMLLDDSAFEAIRR